MAWKEFKFALNSTLQHGNSFIKLLQYQNRVSHKSGHFPFLEIPGRQATADLGKFQFYTV